MTDDSHRHDIDAQDEILQVMFWLEGEGLAGEVTPELIARFTGASTGRVRQSVQQLMQRHLIVRVAEDRVALTPDGRREGARRFADEFADYTRRGHGECHDASCECHADSHGGPCRTRPC